MIGIVLSYFFEFDSRPNVGVLNHEMRNKQQVGIAHNFFTDWPAGPMGDFGMLGGSRLTR